jgi:UDP-glucose 4-epimerase
MNQIMQEQPMTVFGDGSQTRAFSYIDDVAPIIARSVDVPEAYNKIINIGADQPYTVNELAETVARSFGIKPWIQHLAARNEVRDAYPDHDRARQVFGLEATVPLEEGIARMATWAKRVGARASQQFESLEIIRNLPPSWDS